MALYSFKKKKTYLLNTTLLELFSTDAFNLLKYVVILKRKKKTKSGITENGRLFIQLWAVLGLQVYAPMLAQKIVVLDTTLECKIRDCF